MTSKNGRLDIPSTAVQGAGDISSEQLQTQILVNRYLDLDKLTEVLKELFDKNWKVQLKNGRYILLVPRQLTGVSPT